MPWTVKWTILLNLLKNNTCHLIVDGRCLCFVGKWSIPRRDTRPRVSGDFASQNHIAVRQLKGISLRKIRKCTAFSADTPEGCPYGSVFILAVGNGLCAVPPENVHVFGISEGNNCCCNVILFQNHRNGTQAVPYGVVVCGESGLYPVGTPLRGNVTKLRKAGFCRNAETSFL